MDKTIFFIMTSACIGSNRQTSYDSVISIYVGWATYSTGWYRMVYGNSVFV